MWCKDSASLYAFGLSTLIATATVAAACSATNQTGHEEDGDLMGSGGGDGGNGSPDVGQGGSQGALAGPASGAGGGGATPCTANDPNVDADGDGFFPPLDCNDCDKNVNPGAIEVVISDPQGNGGPPEPVDEDCDGIIDNAPSTCDANLALDDGDPLHGAAAIDLCREATASTWGIINAAYVRANGQPASASPQVGIMENFGPYVNVQRGARMLALSSGHARLPGQPGQASGHKQHTIGPLSPLPSGYPQPVPNCPGALVIEDGGLSKINDDVALEVKLRAPTNATGYRFFFKFYSFEYAEYVCTPFNDQFVALVNPPPPGSQNGNISFDSLGNPVSVNIAFFDVCNPADKDFGAYCFNEPGVTCPSPPQPFCPSGLNELLGTGFNNAFGTHIEDGGATSWLETKAPITGGEEVTIRFAIWDTTDQDWDSSVLIDGFEWIANGGTVKVETGEIPDPT